MRHSHVAPCLRGGLAEPVDQERLGDLARAGPGDRVGPGVQVADQSQPARLYPLQEPEQAGHRITALTVGQRPRGGAVQRLHGLFDQGQRLEHGMRRGLGRRRLGRVAAGLLEVVAAVSHETTVATTTDSPDVPEAVLRQELCVCRTMRSVTGSAGSTSIVRLRVGVRHHRRRRQPEPEGFGRC